MKLASIVCRERSARGGVESTDAARINNINI